jgi:hypothetical protein
MRKTDVMTTALCERMLQAYEQGVADAKAMKAYERRVGEVRRLREAKQAQIAGHPENAKTHWAYRNGLAYGLRRSV